MNPSSFITLDDVFVVPDISLWTQEDPYRYTVVTELHCLRDASHDPVVMVD